MTALSKILKFARLRQRLSLRKVEAATGIPNATIFQFETGKIKDPSFYKIQKLCKFYGINLNSLPEQEIKIKEDKDEC